MDFKQLIEEIKEIEFETVRVDDRYYFEAVISRDKVPSLTEKLTKAFGEPICPPEKEVPAEIQKQIEDLGGIRDDQVLYFLKEGGHVFFAMLWPWSNEYHITVEIGRR